MDTNWIIIGAVIILGLALVIYLIWQNQKDKKDVVNYFNHETAFFEDDEAELNDEK